MSGAFALQPNPGHDWPDGDYSGMTCANCQSRFSGPHNALLCYPCYSANRVPAFDPEPYQEQRQADLEKDKERLDWLDTLIDPGYDGWKIGVPDNATIDMYVGGLPIREAIDAAMKK